MKNGTNDTDSTTRTTDQPRRLGDVIVNFQRYGSKVIEQGELKDLPTKREVFVAGTVSQLDIVFDDQRTSIVASFVLTTHMGERVSVSTIDRRCIPFIENGAPVELEGWAMKGGKRKPASILALRVFERSGWRLALEDASPAACADDYRQAQSYRNANSHRTGLMMADSGWGVA